MQHQSKVLLYFIVTFLQLPASDHCAELKAIPPANRAVDGAGRGRCGLGARDVLPLHLAQTTRTKTGAAATTSGRCSTTPGHWERSSSTAIGATPSPGSLTASEFARHHRSTPSASSGDTHAPWQKGSKTPSGACPYPARPWLPSRRAGLRRWCGTIIRPAGTTGRPRKSSGRVLHFKCESTFPLAPE